MTNQTAFLSKVIYSILKVLWNIFRERAEHELSQKLEALALARQEDERKLEALSQEILDSQLEASRQAQTQMQDQSKRIADQVWTLGPIFWLLARNLP